MKGRKYRRVIPVIWRDQKFRALPDDAKLAFLFLLTCNDTMQIGTLSVFPQGLAAVMGWQEQRFRQCLDELSGHQMIEFDADAGLIWIRNYLKHNPPDNRNQVQSWAGIYADLPECSLKDTIGQALEHFRKQLPKQFSDGMPNGIGNGIVNMDNGTGTENGYGDGDGDGGETSPQDNSGLS